MTAGRPPHGLFCPSGRSLLAAHSYPALTRGHTTTLPYLATLPRLSPGPAIRPSSSSCPSYPALTRGHTTTLPCLATLPRLSSDPTHPAVLTLPPIRPPAVPDLRHAPSVARSFLPPSGRPLLAAHPAARRSSPAVRPGLSPCPPPGLLTSQPLRHPSARRSICHPYAPCLITALRSTAPPF